MPRSGSTTAELALPVESLAALRNALEAQVGGDATAQVLRQAGYAAGDALFPLLASGSADAIGTTGQLPEELFWRRLAELFAARGWGRLEFSAIHPALGALEAADWVEADATDSSLRPNCHFTTGVLANLLGHAAGEEIGVLEVECRSRGDLACRFLFGGHDALTVVYEALAGGQELDQALAQLAQVARVLGVDFGERRIGLAVSDPTGMIAQPLPTLARRAGKRPPVQAVADLARTWQVAAIVVGLPLTLEGDDSDWTRETRAFGEKLSERTGLPVHFVDERMTSVRAERAVRSLGLRRAQREDKARIDAAAAVLILQSFLDRGAHG